MKYYTDMAFEKFNTHFKADEIMKVCEGIEKIVVNINNQDKARYYGKPIGRYVCINATKYCSFEKLKVLSETLANELNVFIEKSYDKKSVLVIGLGNDDIVCDMLGNLVCRNLVVNSKSEVNENFLYTFCPSVKGKTGIESLTLIKSVLKDVRADVVLIVDSLYAVSVARLGNSFQLSNGGMKLNGEELTENTLGVPVLVLGCPFAIKVDTVVNKILESFFECNQKVKLNLDCLNGEENVVTLLDVKERVVKVANMFSLAINMAVYDLKFEDLFVF